MGDTGYVANTILGEGAIGGASLDVSGATGSNTALGYQCIFNLTTGANNVAVGHAALYSLTTGIHNIAIGKYTSETLTEGIANVAVGSDALKAATTGDFNVCVGQGAGGGITTGSNNILIGYNAGAAAPAGDYQINIGNVFKGDATPGSIYITLPGGVVANTTRITGATTLGVSHNVVFANTDGGAYTVSLPAGIEGTHYKIINCGSSGNDLTVDPNGTEEIYGGGAGVAQTLSDGEVINIHYNTTEGWF